MTFLLRVLFFLSLSLAALPLRAEQVTVFAAASLRDALREAGAVWEAETGHSLRLSFAGSSALARQVQAGAPVDLIWLANREWMSHLEAQGLLQNGPQVPLVGNRLVLIGPSEAPPLSLGPEVTARLAEERLAMALVEAVPAGIYGKAALEHFGLWQNLAPKVAQADNVRAALALVALGEAPLGIVYASDAMAEPRVRILATFPPESHPAITYPGAIVADSTATAASDLLTFLQSPIAKEVFLRHGFTDPPQESH